MDEKAIQAGRVITDALNAAALDFAAAQIAFRRSVVEAMPPALLLN